MMGNGLEYAEVDEEPSVGIYYKTDAKKAIIYQLIRLTGK